MDETIKYIKDLFSFLWKPAKTPEEKAIKRYDTMIAVCVIFMIGYSCVFLYNLEAKINSHVDSNTSDVSSDYDQSIYTSPDSTLSPKYPPTTITNNEFYVGELVGIKYFGVFGLIVEKTIGVEGYKYTVRWRTTTRDLPTSDFYAYDLYRPAPHSIPISVLQN